MAVIYRYVGILTVDVVVFFRSPGVFHSQDSFPSMFRPQLWETSSGVVAVGVFTAEALQASAASIPIATTPEDVSHSCSLLRLCKLLQQAYL